jgi:hypothetical protein
VSYPALLRLEGGCSVVLGLALLAGGLGWTDDVLLLAAWAAASTLAVAALGRFRAPGRWFTEGPLARVAGAGRPLAPGPLRRRLLAETALWVVAVVAWLVVSDGSSAELIAGTGVASAVFGAAQAGPGAARARAEERRRGHRLVVVRRPGLGAPTVAEAQAS